MMKNKSLGALGGRGDLGKIGLAHTAVEPSPTSADPVPLAVQLTPTVDGGTSPQPAGAPTASHGPQTPTRSPVAEPTPRPAAAAPAQGKGQGGNLTIRASKDLLARYETHKKRTGLSYPNVLFNAIEATYDQLPELLSRQQIKTPGVNLFGRPETVTTIERDDAEKITKSMRISGHHMNVLDTLARELAQNNRNRLITTALTEYLKDDQ
jgi:hypothetical protein